MAARPRALRVIADGPDFAAHLREQGLGELRRATTTTLQVNVGRRCNQACHHCHVDAGPKRTETMAPVVIDRLLALLEASPQVTTVDITGGAPELCDGFRRLVTGARALGREVIDRCNLTILYEPGQEDLATFLAEHQVHVIASLPCYSRDNVDRQRGRGVFDKSLAALRLLNELGYGRPGTGRRLDLVYNPGGPSLPPAQAPLEQRYRVELAADHGLVFDQLFTITNLPIARFADELTRSGRYDAYLALLVNHFNPSTVDGLMCRSLLSVDWTGRLYDCDFNQMLELPAGERRRTVFELDQLGALDGGPVATGAHCFGCTAGAGSSCGGALA